MNGADACRLPDPKVIDLCPACWKEIYIGQDVVEYYNRFFCDYKCLASFLVQSKYANCVNPVCHLCGNDSFYKVLVYDGELFCSEECLAEYLENYTVGETGRTTEEGDLE